ncbi:hypothetical protein MMC34_001459 [Xylographa carneopallida]|nr:hypothetical protein [Xylographa carneopallida]
MPFVSNTPESRLPRSDSKDPSTTCRGITLNGNRCKNSIAVSSYASPAQAARIRQTVLPNADNQNEGAAAFFCWRHKNQAETLAPAAAHDMQQKTVDLRKRTSIDTLVDRLGLLDIKENRGSKGKNSTKQTHRPTKQEQRTSRPLITVSEKPLHTDEMATSPPARQPRQQRKQTGSIILHLSVFFCLRAPDLEDKPPPPRIRTAPPMKYQPEMAQTGNPQPRKRLSTAQYSSPSQPPNNHHPRRPTLNPASPPPSQTHALLALIPPTLTPRTTSLLLAELAKPFPSDSSPGYIYIFWLTPTSIPFPSPTTASSLLASPDQPPHRTSDTIRPFTLPSPTSPKTLMLKIGRATNVQRRLHEWTRQCGFHVSLVRYYPYQPSSGAWMMESEGEGQQLAAECDYPRQVPHVARVERLIHLELGGGRARGRCAGCGREHREWFEVGASRDGVRAVDEVVRRWVGWGEGMGMGMGGV